MWLYNIMDYRQPTLNLKLVVESKYIHPGKKSESLTFWRCARVVFLEEHSERDGGQGFGPVARKRRGCEEECGDEHPVRLQVSQGAAGAQPRDQDGYPQHRDRLWAKLAMADKHCQQQFTNVRWVHEQ